MSQTLNPNSSRGSMQRSHRTRSPAGTRRKPHGTEASTGGAVLFVQGPDHHTAEEHELEEVSISEDRHSHDALGIETTGQPRSFRSHVHQRASYATDSETDSQIVERRYRDPEFSQPRTDTSDSEDRAQQNRPESLWSQNDTHVPRRNLSTFDVAALIFNKMVGSGIFTTPGAVLMLTGSKPLSVGLWAIGGVYTLLCMFIYLEYGIALPYTGGEMIYLDRIFNRPRFFATIVFSGFFLFLANSTGNSLTFSKHVLIASLPEKKTTTDFDERLVRFIAISILTTICLIHYFSSKLGLFLNKFLALYKAVLLLAVFIAGVKASNQPGSGRTDWYDKHGPNGHTNGIDSLAASVLILYAYQGWENANYVAGEIDTPDVYFKRGAFLAVSMVTILYVLVATAYYMACDFATITRQDTDLGMAILFAPKAFGGNGLGLKISIALSAAGNLVAVIYTSSKVKQAIARQGFIPFHEFFAKDWNIPKGGLVLQWFTSMLMISFTPNTADGYSFVVGIFTYCHLIITICVAVGLFWLEKRMQASKGNYRLDFLHKKPVLVFTIIVFIGVNMLAIVFGAKQHSKGKIPRFWWPVIFTIVFAASSLYWLVFWYLQQGIATKNGPTTVGRALGLEVKVYDDSDSAVIVPKEMEGALAQAKLDGTNRRTQYKYSGIFALLGQWYRTTVNGIGEWVF